MEMNADKKPRRCNYCMEFFFDEKEFLQHFEEHRKLDKYDTYQCHLCLLLCTSQLELVVHFVEHCNEQQEQGSEAFGGFHDVKEELSVQVKTEPSNHYDSDTAESGLEDNDEGQKDENSSFAADHASEDIKTGNDAETNSEANQVESRDKVTQNSATKKKTPKKKRKWKKDFSKRYQCDVCQEFFRLGAALELHKLSHTGQEPFTCKVCGKKFGSFNRKCHHEKRECGVAAPWECKVCGKCYAVHTGLRFHEKAVHMGERVREFVCTICGKDFLSKGHLTKHDQAIHKQEMRYCCHLCGKSYVSYTPLAFHMETHDIEKPHKCEKCGKGFNKGYILNQHMAQKHSTERPHQCAVCGMRFRLPYRLRAHMNTHLGDARERPHECDKCHKRFFTQRDLAGHMKLHMAGLSFQCASCGKKFRHKGSLRKHEAKHEQGAKTSAPSGTNGDQGSAMAAPKDAALFECRFCHKKYSKKYRLDYHEREAHAARSASRHCDVCNQTFPMFSYDFKEHHMIHTGEKPYGCDVCGKGLKSSRLLEKHVETHTQARPFACNVCGKTFTVSRYLTQHSRLHMLHLLHACAQCDMSFARKDALVKHMKIHNDDRQFQCETCSKAFVDKDSLLQHQTSCSGQERTFKCSLCSEQFLYMSHFKEHKRMHTEGKLGPDGAPILSVNVDVESNNSVSLEELSLRISEPASP